MTRPVRLRLSRRRGFDLQALSLRTNGLEAVNVARPTKWGNPYRADVAGALVAVNMFEIFAAPRLPVADLKGKNLACWCAPDAPCHADVLLRLAND